MTDTKYKAIIEEFRKNKLQFVAAGTPPSRINWEILEDSILQALARVERETIEKVVKRLITIRDIEMEGAPNLMKTRAGYNVNLLINDLLQKAEEKEE